MGRTAKISFKNKVKPMTEVSDQGLGNRSLSKFFTWLFVIGLGKVKDINIFIILVFNK